MAQEIEDDFASHTPAQDIVGAIIEFEQGTLSQDETIELFQELVDRGLAWQLQGMYGRLASELIARGYVRPHALNS